MVNLAMVDSLVMKKGLKRPREVDASDANRVETLTIVEVLRNQYRMVKGEVNEIGREGIMNVGDPHKIELVIVDGRDDKVGGEEKGRDVEGKVVTTSVVRGLLYEEEVKGDIVERTRVVIGLVVVLRGIVKMGPIKIGFSRPELEDDVVEGEVEELTMIPPPPNYQDRGKIDPLLKFSVGGLWPPYREGTLGPILEVEITYLEWKKGVGFLACPFQHMKEVQHMEEVHMFKSTPHHTIITLLGCLQSSQPVMYVDWQCSSENSRLVIILTRCSRLNGNKAVGESRVASFHLNIVPTHGKFSWIWVFRDLY
eukprot:Gb_34255 [translate_table: standard]